MSSRNELDSGYFSDVRERSPRCIPDALRIIHVKNEPTIVYVKLYGDAVSRSQRFTVMNALENYFWQWGKIKDIGRLKEKYSHLGDFFITFQTLGSAVQCSIYHLYNVQDLVPAPQLGLPSFKMKVW